MRRVLLFVLLVGFCLAVLGPAGAADDERAIVVAGVAGPLEQRAIDFLTAAVRSPDAVLVVLQIDNPGVASGDLEDLYTAITGSDVPVTVWVGPAGAEALGGAGRLVATAAYAGAAPGARIGYLDQPTAGGPIEPFPEAQGMPYGAGVVEVETAIPGLVDGVAPTLLNFVADLDGQEVGTAAGAVTLDTVVTTGDGDAFGFTHPLRFLKPGLLDRTLRLAMRPEAAFFFLVTGLVMVAFEMYTLGAGIAAAVAVATLFLAGFGMASLPMRWTSVLAVLAGLILYAAEFQGRLGELARRPRHRAARRWRPDVRGCRPAVLDAVVGGPPRGGGGRRLLPGGDDDGGAVPPLHPHHRPGATGGEARGVAETGFDPMGLVDVDGARWRGRSHRAAGIGPGDAVEVLSVSGIMLEVGPVDDVTRSS